MTGPGRTARRPWLGVVLGALGALGAAADAPAPRPGAGRVAFEDVSAASGFEAVRQHPPLFDVPLRHINALWANMMAGAASADVDGDGLDDVLFVAGRPDESSRLYLNRGGLRFRDATAGAGLAQLSDARNAAVGALFFDYDDDGRPDLFVYRFGRALLFHNEGGARFRDVTARSGLGRRYHNSLAAVAFDADDDGRLDLLLGGYFADDADVFALRHGAILPEDGENASNGGSLVLYRNRGGGRFEDISARSGLDDTGFTTALGHGDLDGDGRQDVYVANDFGPDKLYRNRGGGRFEDVSERALGADGRKGMNADFGDFDNDGRLDVYVTNITEPWMSECNMLWRNRGDGTFVDVSRETGACDAGWAWGAKFFDADNDGWLDLFVANGFVTGRDEPYEPDVARWMQRLEADPSLHMRDAAVWPALEGRTFAGRESKRLFLNQGGVFEELAQRAGIDDRLDGRGVLVADFDLDGRVDLLVTHCGAPPRLYRNTSAAGHWLELTLRGRSRNRDAVGARVRLLGADGEQVREVNGGNGFAAQSPRRLHFGLGAETRALALEIRWPSGTRETWRDVAAGQRLEIVEGASETQAGTKPRVLPRGRTIRR